MSRRVILQDRVKPSLAVPSFTALANQRRIMKQFRATRIRHKLGQIVDVLFANRSRNHVPQCLDQFKQKTSGPRAALETTFQNAGCTTSDGVAVSVVN